MEIRKGNKIIISKGRYFKLSIFKNIDFWIYFLLIFISFAVACYSQLPALRSQYVIADDAMQHTYWMDKFHDKELFNNDIFVQFNSFVSPLGFKLLYYILTFFLDPFFAGHLLCIILYVISGIFLFKLGKLMQDNYVGIILFLLFICFPAYIHIEKFSGGLQKAFEFPLLVIFIYYCLKFDIKKCTLILILQILFYPLIFLVSYLTMFFTFLLSANKIKKTILSKNTLFVILLPPIVLFSFLLFKLVTIPSFLGKLSSIEVIYNNLSSNVYGRSPSLPVENILSVIKRMLFQHRFFIFSAQLFFFYFLYDIFRKRYDELSKYKIIFSLFASSIIMYHLATIFLLKLYLPIKYVRFSLPLISIFIISLGIGFLLKMIRIKHIKIFLLFVFIILVYFVYGYTIMQGAGLTVDERKHAQLYEYLSTLPKNVMIAANPYLSDYISSFSKKRVFVKYELAFPWFDNYAKIVEKRMLDFYKAYYSDSGKQIYKFCNENEIEFFVIYIQEFTEEYLEYFLSKNKKDFSFESLNKQIRQIMKSERTFFLPHINKDKILFQTKDKEYFVVRADAETLLNNGK